MMSRVSNSESIAVLCILVGGRRCLLGAFFRLTHTEKLENMAICVLYCFLFFQVPPPTTNMHSTIRVQSSNRYARWLRCGLSVYASIAMCRRTKRWRSVFLRESCPWYSHFQGSNCICKWCRLLCPQRPIHTYI